MRIVGLCLIGLASYLVAMVVFFPASPLIDRVRQQMPMVAMQGVNGKIYNGIIDSVRYTDDLLPLEFSNVGWTLAPSTLLSGGAGATIRFDAYGGQGVGKVQRQWNGDLVINNFKANLLAKELEPLLPVPVASFSGEVSADIEQMRLANQVLTRLSGALKWENAVLESPVPTALGDVNIDIEQVEDEAHIVTVAARGGDVSADGTVSITSTGDFNADILLTPSGTAPVSVVDSLRQIGRPDSQGRVRIQQQGNVNRLM
ncbi:MAG: type II secretion system protein N [Granulosicoccus sp.]